MIVTEHIGKRVLVKMKRGYQEEILEVFVLEASPSQNYVRIQTEHGNKHWKAIGDVLVIEKLKPFEKNPESVEKAKRWWP